MVVLMLGYAAHRFLNEAIRIEPTYALNMTLSQWISIAIFVGCIVSSPVWLYQLWAFIVPGLTKKERRISLAFIAATVCA